MTWKGASPIAGTMDVRAQGITYRLPIRWRVAILCALLLTTIMSGFGFGVYQVMRVYLQARTDQSLVDELTEVEDEIRHEATHTLAERLSRRFGQDANNEYQVTDPGGGTIFRSRRLGDEKIHPRETPGEAATLDTLKLNHGGHWRVATQAIETQTGKWVAQVAVSLKADEAILSSLLRTMLVLGPATLLVGLCGGYLLARQALSPIDRLISETSSITAGKLDQRLKVGPHSDEISRLARSLNDMIERLHKSFHEIRRFTGDAAHELRTPLAIIRNAADVGLEEPGLTESGQRILEDILEEVGRLTSLTEQLLYLAREDAGIVPVTKSLVSLDELVMDVMDHLRLVAEEKEVVLEARRIERVAVMADSDRVRRVILNIVDNAIKYTPSGGIVQVDLYAIEHAAHVRIADSGIGIDPRHLPYLFERFYRADEARGDEQRGTGLGLAICKSIVQSHGGEIRVSSRLSEGTCVEIDLPLGD